MNTTMIPRALASTATAVLVTVAGGLSRDAASAYEVSYSAWDAGTNVLLDSAETAAALSQGNAFTSGVCSAAVTKAAQTGVFFPDRARSACPTALIDLCQDAYTKGNALSGARLFADGNVRCLTR